MLRLFWSASIAAEMEYRVNFLIAALTSLGNLAGGVFTLGLFFRGGEGIGGWSWDQALLVMGFFTLLTGVVATVLSPNLSRIVLYVQQGTLDFVLLKPADSQFWVSTRQISPWGLPDVMFGVGLLFYAGARLGLGAMDYLRGVLPLALSLLILYSLWFLLSTTAVWFVKIYNVTEVLRGLMEASRFPLSAYPVAYRFFFTFVVPVALLTTVPAESMLGLGGGRGVLIAAAFAVALLAASRWFWRFALRYYTSASS